MGGTTSRQTVAAAREARAGERAARARQRAARRELVDAEIAAGLRSAPPRWPTLVATLALAGALVLAGLGITAWVSASAAPTDEDFRRAAVDRVSVLLGPDHRDPDQAARILSGATGLFAEEFARSADSYTSFVSSRGTIAHAQIDGTAVSGREGDEATVLVAARVDFDGDEAASQSFRLRVLVVDQSGVFRLGAVQYLP